MGKKLRAAWVIGLAAAISFGALRIVDGGRNRRSVARTRARHLQGTSACRRRRLDRDRHAGSRRGCRDRAGHVARHAAARRRAHAQGDHAGHRRKSGAGRRHLQGRRRRDHDLDAGAGEFLHQRPCRGRAERRQALCREDLCESVRRLLGPDGQERRASQGEHRANAISAICQIPRDRPAARAKRRS